MPSHAFLMNWLANLSGKLNAFKEMDLLQEHQNFWLKVSLTSLNCVNMDEAIEP